MDIKRKIAALLAMTVRSGCTEAEAMAAAAKAASLMLEYGLSEADIYIDDQTTLTKSSGHGVRDPLWSVVARCTNCACIFQPGPRVNTVQFIGRAPGPQIAVYLHAVLDRAMDRAIRDFKGSSVYRRRRSAATRRQAVEDFTAAMVVRLADRLQRMFRPTMSSARALEAKEALKARHPRLTTVSNAPRGLRSGSAADAGWLAGGAIGLSHGVGGGAQELRQLGGNAA